MFHVKQISFTDAKARKYVAEHLFDIDAAGDALQSARREPQVFRDQLQLSSRGIERALQRAKRLGESARGAAPA